MTLKNEYFVDDFQRLSWACRRGMLELDVLLGNFLKWAYDELDQQAKYHFGRLLHCQDPDLFAWLMGQNEPVDPELQAIVKRIKSCKIKCLV